MTPESLYSGVRVDVHCWATTRQTCIRIRKEQSRYCWIITVETVFSVGSEPRLYNEDPRPAEVELTESLETAVEDDWEEMATHQLSFETAAWQEMSLGAEELNWGIEASELLSAIQWNWKSGCEEKTLCGYNTAIFGVWNSVRPL
jgi:hypothetical protein